MTDQKQFILRQLAAQKPFDIFQQFADQEQFNTLQQGVEVWNTWREQNLSTPIILFDANLRNTDLRNANLRNANLVTADLTDADLTSADLTGANLSNNFNRVDYRSIGSSDGANLHRVKLKYANLTYADLTDANLTYADLTDANLTSTNFMGADLTDADLSGTTVWNTIFGNVDLRTVKGLDKMTHIGPSTIGTNTLERSHGEISEVFLRGAGLSDTLIQYARSLVQKPIDYYTCFISYSSQDEVFAKRLHNDLQAEGVRCWFAPEDMKIGDKIRHHIDESIRVYDELLIVLSEHSLASTWVENEVETAFDKEQ